MKSVLQVAYHPALADQRHTLLLQAGYRAVTARNNADAREACAQQRFDAILLGFASPLPHRKEMFDWLREHCPGVPIVSLFSRQFVPVPRADFAVDGEEPSAWLRLLDQILA